MFQILSAAYAKTLTRKKMALHLRAKQGDKVMSPPDEEGRSKQVSADELKQEAAELYTDSKARKERSDKYIRNVQISEKIALHSFWIGVLLLTIFAGFNVLKAAVQRPTTQIPPAAPHVSQWEDFHPSPSLGFRLTFRALLTPPNGEKNAPRFD